MSKTIKFKIKKEDKDALYFYNLLYKNFFGQLVDSFSVDKKIYVINVEKYYFRVSSTIGMNIVIIEKNYDIEFRISSFGSGDGILNLSFGSDESYVNSVTESLRKNGFELHEV